MIIVSLALALLLVVFGVERSIRKRRRDKLGTSAARPEHVKLVEHQITGPRRSKRWAGTSPGDLGSSKDNSAAARAVRRSYWWALARIHNKGPALRRLLRSTGIVVFVGPNGSGKSLMCVESVQDLIGRPWSCDDLDHWHNRPVRDHARPCADCSREALCDVGRALLEVHNHGARLAYSTVELLDWSTGEPHEHFRQLYSLRQLPRIEHAVVVFDEVEEVAGVDQSATMPGALKRWLKQLRKRDVLLRVTTPGYDSCAKAIRQITTLVVDCRSFYDEPLDNGRAWRPRSAMVFEAYDAFEFASFDKSSGKRLVSAAREFYWRESNVGHLAYNSLAQVSGLSEVDESGACVNCNGSRGRAKCGCTPESYEWHPDDVEVIEYEGPRGGKERRAVLRTTADAAELEPAV